VIVNPAPRVAVFGNGDVAISGIQILREIGAEIPVVVCDYSDDGVDSWRKSLFKYCKDVEKFIPSKNLLKPASINDEDFLCLMENFNIDFILSLQCRQIIGSRLINIPNSYVINLHNAPLPLLRGCDPFSWAITDGLALMGVTLHQVEDIGVDSGSIFSQILWEIHENDTSWSLYLAALSHSESLLRRDLAKIFSLEISSVPQLREYSSYHPVGQFDFSSLEIDWTSQFRALSSWIRSRIFNPIQLPYFLIGDTKIEVLECQSKKISGQMGEILSINPLVISARGGAIQINKFLVNGILFDEHKSQTSLLKLHTRIIK
jgi:methionyl-tRNA formyltransferase